MTVRIAVLHTRIDPGTFCMWRKSVNHTTISILSVLTWDNRYEVGGGSIICLIVSSVWDKIYFTWVSKKKFDGKKYITK
jgi:hypothetical protein